MSLLQRAVFALPVSGLRPVAGCARVGGRCFSELSEKSNDGELQRICWVRVDQWTCCDGQGALVRKLSRW